ncbi:MAG: hypothetical protein J1F05_01460 [Muribaculaceae bacterium]|nr:hypothetical protein [Muribaculaceae bacterium]
MKKLRYISVALALTGIVGCILPCRAADVTLKASADSAVMLMGDRNHLKVTVDIPKSYSSTAQLVDFPILPPGVEYIEYNGVDVVESDSSSVVAKNGDRHIDFDFTIQAFDPGTITLPPFAVIATPGADTAYSNVVTFKVVPVDVDSLETINPMASVVAPATKWYDYIPDWLLWTLFVIAVVIGAVWAFLATRKHKEIVEQRRTPPVPPYELAVARLNELKSRKLAESGQEKEYYTRLVDILREYLQGRFGIYAMEMTSTQIVRALRSNPDTRMTADEMREVLSIADFVKFAKVRPLPDDNIKAFARAQNFVEKTKPVPVPEESEGQPDVKPNNDKK